MLCNKKKKTHTHTLCSVLLDDGSVSRQSPLPKSTQNSQETDVYTLDGILTELRGIIKLTRTRHLKGDTAQETAGP